MYDTLARANLFPYVCFCILLVTLALDSKEPILSGSKSVYQKAVEFFEPLFPKILCWLGLLLATAGIIKLLSSEFNLETMGTVLAGVFTGSAAFFTLANLVYNSQKDRERAEEMRLEKERQIEKDQEQTQFILDQSKLISRQLELSELEQYTKHRELFNERLNHIEKGFEHKFEFADPFQLYRAAFPHNQIGQTSIRYKVKVHSDTPTDLEDAVNGYQILANKIKGYHSLSPRELTDFPLSLLMLHDRLQIRYDQQTKIPGDIFFRDLRTGINCFKMREAVHELTYVLNELLEFTGNERIISFEDDADVSWTQEGLLDFFTDKRLNKDFCIYDPHNSIASVYRIRKYSNKVGSYSIFPQIYITCCEITQNKSDLIKFEDINFCNNLGRQLMTQLDAAEPVTKEKEHLIDVIVEEVSNLIMLT